MHSSNSITPHWIMGNLLTIDIFSKAKKLHIEAKPRVTFVIDTGSKNTDLVMEMVKNLSNLKAGDFVTTVDEHSVVLVKDISYMEAVMRNSIELEEELGSIAMSLVDSIHMEAMVKVRVGYGNVVTEISDIAQSFQEAKMALQVGKVFYVEKETISYGKLGIGRLRTASSPSNMEILLSSYVVFFAILSWSPSTYYCLHPSRVPVP